MIRPWRPLWYAAVVFVIAGAGSARAQTVYVLNAPPVATVAVQANQMPLGSATADELGDATVAVNLFSEPGVTEMAMHIYVDGCGQTQRIVLVERTVTPPPAGVGCTRRELAGYFVLRAETSVVIDVGPAYPIVRIRQGRPPSEWLSHDPTALLTLRTVPLGLILFGAAGISDVRDATTLMCGNTATCTAENAKTSFAAGATYWLNENAGVEASYIKSMKPYARGGEGDFSFESYLDADVFTVSGNVGLIATPFRLFGRIGATYHRATMATTETIGDILIVVDGVEQTVTGGTGTFVVETHGWGWLAGGGLEIYATNRFAMFAEGGWTQLRGSDLHDGEATIDDRLAYGFVGISMRLGGP